MSDCPNILRGRDWVSDSRWPLTLLRGVSTTVPRTGYSLLFMSGEQILGRMATDGRITVCSAYSCDGYSPVLKTPRGWLRLTPTPRCGMFPAVLHDFLRQFVAVPGCPWSRKDSDDWFYDAMLAGGSKRAAAIYHGTVAGPLGNAFICLTRKTDPKLRIVTP